MADVNIYDISAHHYIGALTVLVDILKKAAQQPDASTFPDATLIADMKPLTFHVQSVTKTVSRSLSRLLETEVQAWEDTETTMEELIQRAEACLAMLRGLDPATFVGKEKTVISLPAGEFVGKQFILGFGVPNIYFHLNMVYAILRMKGVPLGKADYLSPWHRPEA
ncbi:hypothetical protein PFICI_04958 [Pestalotiopsis fici W106-1]|uniref:DUF1993 domain-containing protein n=1 Tax=Pestalotiopsis fici (strain W106-1 / CGMCC3.15140) TaxID=1229662 RepID=W3XCA9_PESFW|nr:uncharacterized protein PFICI_04958 [Pestalotiopsis fici W106-1]ETS83082.1 hypothetical protein PFICI_04958 [Pestalotiopsis fici W106-1]